MRNLPVVIHPWDGTDHDDPSMLYHHIFVLVNSVSPVEFKMSYCVCVSVRVVDSWTNRVK